MSTLESELTGLTERIKGVKESQKAIAQLFYGLDEEPNVNSVGLKGIVYSPKSKGKTSLTVDKADYDKMKHLTFEELDNFEKHISDIIEQWLELPKYVAVRFDWKGTYVVDYVIEPILFLGELESLIKPAPAEPKEAPESAKASSTTVDSVKDMAPPAGSKVAALVPLSGKSSAEN